MLKVLFTLDYEIHGNGEGCPYELMVEPTKRLMDLFEKYGAKLTIMADVAEILKFREYKEQRGRDDYHYEAIAEQLREAIRRGHDVQLHLHASYFNAHYENGRWQQDWSEYNFAGLPRGRLNEIIRGGKQFLENLLKPIDSKYECIAFRAANWSMSPSRDVVRALLQNNIRIDTSVFKYGRREGIVSFDYSKAHSDLIPWLADENDICRQNGGGKLMEVPIYSEHRWIGAFLTPSRLYRARMTRAHSLTSDYSPSVNGTSARKSPGEKILKMLSVLTRRHAWKADFNQCSGRQLVGALNRASLNYAGRAGDLPFVLIGHSKLFTSFNERSLRPLLSYVKGNPNRFGFSIFSDVELSADGPGFQSGIRGKQSENNQSGRQNVPLASL
jgi:peptidoglycan/xylan/chitin deacetylase (PgdA/CDA1 family)